MIVDTLKYLNMKMLATVNLSKFTKMGHFDGP